MSDRWDETWHRLIEWTNGPGPSERLAAQILLDEDYEALDPSHPLGGPDGGKDATCTKGGRRWAMAVYFPRGQQDLGTVLRKFEGDLTGGARNGADGMVFVTNQELTLADRAALKAEAGGTPVDIYHLERVVSILDKPSMEGVRKQFLGIGRRTDPHALEPALTLSTQAAGQAEGMLRDLATAASLPDLVPDDVERIQKVCGLVSPNDRANFTKSVAPPYEKASWLEYLCHWRDRSKKFTEQALVFSRHLEAEHVARLTAIERCSYFMQLDHMRHFPLIRNTDLSWLASSIWEYLKLVRQLQEFIERARK